MILASLLLPLLLAVTPVELQVTQFPSNGRVSLLLGAKGKADVERSGTVTRVSIQLDAVQPPHVVLSGMNTYVVWVVSPEGSFENLGELDVDKSKASLEATTRFDRFAILITAEPHYMVDRPNFTVMFKNETARNVRSVPLIVRTGEYEYANLPPKIFAVPALLMEARAAVAIAASAGADQLAESEFRQAKVALDTVEQLNLRAAPPDVVSAAANEAIRRAQRAFAFSRQTVR